MPYEPTDEQQAILAHDPEQHARVLAGPGTGKSTTLVTLVDHLLAGNPSPQMAETAWRRGICVRY